MPAGEIRLLDQEVEVNTVRVVLDETPLVSVVVSSAEKLENRHIDELKRIISEQVGREIQLEAQLNIRR